MTLPAATAIDHDGVRIHGYIRSAPSGARVFITEPEETAASGAVRIEDIAHALSQVCRFGGHTRRHYSVAQHCVLVSRLVDPEDALWGLLHDAPEAYMGDLVGPFKREMPERFWKAYEHRWDSVIRHIFKVPFGPDIRPWDTAYLRRAQERRIKAADILLLGREQIDLMPFGREDAEQLGYLDGRRPWTALPRIRPWSARKARRAFLLRFKELTAPDALTWLDRLRLYLT